MKIEHYIIEPLERSNRKKSLKIAIFFSLGVFLINFIYIMMNHEFLFAVSDNQYTFALAYGIILGIIWGFIAFVYAYVMIYLICKFSMFNSI